MLNDQLADDLLTTSGQYTFGPPPVSHAAHAEHHAAALE